MTENNRVAVPNDSPPESSDNDSNPAINGPPLPPSPAAVSPSQFASLLTDFQRLVSELRDRLRVDRRMGITQLTVGVLGILGIPGIVLVINCVLPGPIGTPESIGDSEFDQDLDSADGLVQEGSVVAAIDAYRTIATAAEGANDRLASYAWMAVGFLSSQMDDSQNALLAYGEAIRLQPQNADAYDGRGNVKRERLDQARDAISDYDMAIRLRPDFAAAYLHRGLAERRLGRIEAAIENYDEVIRLRPRKGITWINRGAAYSDLGDHERALADYTEAIRLLPAYAGIYINRGNTNLRLGREGEALADYDTAISLEPESPFAYVSRGNVRLKVGRQEDALADFDMAIELQPENPRLYFSRVTANVTLERIEAACADLETALTLARTVGLKNPRIDTRNHVVEEVDADRPRILTEAVDETTGFIALINESLARNCGRR